MQKYYNVYQSFYCAITGRTDEKCIASFCFESDAKSMMKSCADTTKRVLGGVIVSQSDNEIVMEVYVDSSTDKRSKEDLTSVHTFTVRCE